MVCYFSNLVIECAIKTCIIAGKPEPITILWILIFKITYPIPAWIAFLKINVVGEFVAEVNILRKN